MKKFIAVVSSLIMILCMSSVAFAANPVDGSYQISVGLEGGTGKMKVESCTLNVSGGSMSAHIVLSSTGYTWLQINGTQYTNEAPAGSKSTFTVPVSALDTPIHVTGETVTMSEPHQIDYTFTFSSQGVTFEEEKAEQAEQPQAEKPEQPQQPKAEKQAETDKNNNDSEKGKDAPVEEEKATTTSLEKPSEKTTEETIEATTIEARMMETETAEETESEGGIPVVPVVVTVVVLAVVAGGAVALKKKNN